MQILELIAKNLNPALNVVRVPVDTHFVTDKGVSEDGAIDRNALKAQSDAALAILRKAA